MPSIPSRIARAFGVAPDWLAAEMARWPTNTPQIVEVGRTKAPVQEVVLAGEAADRTALPVHLRTASMALPPSGL
jgi:hypothetical protein